MESMVKSAALAGGNSARRHFETSDRALTAYFALVHRIAQCRNFDVKLYGTRPLSVLILCGPCIKRSDAFFYKGRNKVAKCVAVCNRIVVPHRACAQAFNNMARLPPTTYRTALCRKPSRRTLCTVVQIHQ